MGSRREEERNEKIIRGLMKLPPNRKCINCNSVGPQYVCTNFWTFVCLSCSGIHREFTHRVKSVSMAKFTTQEVRALEQGGNQRARDIYLKDWDWQRMRLPDNSNPDRIREFIRTVYVDKKYAGGKLSNKTATDSESVKSTDSDMRRPSSYHSYSQSPPYDFQYEDRRYGKPVDVLARRPSDRALFEGKVANLLYSPGQLRDQMHEDRFANESSGSRFSDFSASSTGEFRNDGLSPSSQDTGYSSPSAHHSRNVSAENPQSQLPRRYSSSAPQIDFDGVHPQKVPSSVSFGSLDGSSMSHQSVVSSSLPAAPVERPVHSAVNRQTGASSVPHSTRSQASLPQTGSLSCSGGNLLSHKPVDSSSQTALARGPVQHGRVQVALVAPSSISVQTVTSTTQDLFFDQSTSQLPVTSTTSIDLFTGFNQEISSVSHMAVDSGSHANIVKGSQLPVTSTASIDLFAGFNHEISSVSHKAVDSGSHANVVKGPVYDTVVQKKVVSSSMPSQLTSSHPVHQDLFSLLAPQPPASSSPSIDLFAGFDQQPPSVPHVKQIPSTTPLPANEGWASFSTPQHGASTFVSNVQSQVPTVFPSSDSIAKGVDQLALPTLAPMPQQSALMADQWHLNAEEVKVTASNENPQSWNAFAESAESVPNNFFAFSNKPQEASHQCTIPSSPYVGSTNAKDLVPGEPEMSNPGDMFPGFNVTSGGVAGTFVPPQPMAGLMSQAGKSTNPFDMPCESDFEASEMFMDMSSLQSALPNPQSLTESWFPQNSALSYIPPGPQGGLSYMAGLPQESHILNSTPQGPFPPRNPFE